MHATQNHPARKMNAIQRKAIAIQAINTNVTQIASNNQVSRNFVYQQKNKAMQSIDDAFTDAQSGKILFNLPITIDWIKGFVLSLSLNCRANYRGIQSALEDNFDFHISIGSISKLLNATEARANAHNQGQDLSLVTMGAHDEMFSHNKPILVGADIPSLYCYLLSQEKRRDGETWAINLFDLQKQKFKPERIIADDGDGLRNGHAIALADIPCDYDHFHISKDMMELRRFFRNRHRSVETEYYEFVARANDAIHHTTRLKYQALLPAAEKEAKILRHISSTINTLISWMEHDVFNMPGAQIKQRRELFNFILQEFEHLAKIHPHRLQVLCTKLCNQRDGLLAFVDVLDCKFHEIALKHNCRLDFVWQVCQLQRCEYYGDTYHLRSLPLLAEVGEELFEFIEDDVLAALDSTEKTSSMVENINGRIKAYLHNRKECNQQFLNLLRFYLNHVPFRRSVRPSRINKSPTEILTGKKHPHWLEMLGYTRFKRIAA